MSFAEPIWLLVGALLCAALILLGWRADRLRRAALSRFAAGRLVPQLTASLSPGRRALKRALALGGVAALCLALARPQAGFRWEEVRRQGTDLLFAVDTSRSMLAQDLRPDRLTRAKLAVSDLVDRFAGDRVGLVAFAGDAFLQVPLTLDHEVFREALAALDTGIIPRGGTDLASALRVAREALAGEPRNRKILVLLTDGEDLEGSALQAAADAARDGLTIYTVGVGTGGGELIPVPGPGGGVEFLRDAEGQVVRSRLDEQTLRRIAEVTGGMYRPLGQQGEGLAALYDQALSRLPKQELSSRMRKVPLDRFEWPLGLALLLLLAEPLVGDRRRRAAARPVPRHLPAAAAAGLLLALGPGGAAHASPQSAERAYRAGDYAAARKDYAAAAARHPDDPVLRFNLAAAGYKGGAYDEAAQDYGRALPGAPLPLQQQAYYGLGNAQFRLGQRTEKDHPEQTVERWRQAIQAYESALKLRPDDADARYNLELVKRKLAALQQKQQQQQQRAGSQGQQKQDQKDKGQQQAQQDKGQQQGQKDKGQQQASQGKGQQQQDHQGKGQQQQDHQGKGQQQAQAGRRPQDQGQQGQDQQQAQGGQRPQQGQPGPGPKDQAPQQALADQRPQQDQAQPGQGAQDAVAEPGQEQRQGEAASARERAPGQLTREEAKALLDSLRGEGRRMPAAISKGGAPAQQREPTKDW